MSGEAPPQVAVLGADDDRYRVSGRLEVASLLRGLVAQHALVTAHGSGGFFVTALLEVDEDAGRLVFDYGVDALATERLLRQSTLVFVTQLDHVRIQFAARNLHGIDYEGGRAFTAPIPDSLTRLQRREHYRLRVPAGRPLHCDFALPPEGGEVPGRRLSLPVYDISCGGVALTGWPDGHRPRPGLALAGASLVLPDLGTLVCDLHVVHVQGTVGRGVGAGRFGCRFLDLRPGDATLVQRYINRVERERRAML